MCKIRRKGEKEKGEDRGEYKRTELRIF